MKQIIYNDPYIKKNILDYENLYNKDFHFYYLSNIINEIDHSYNIWITKELKKKFNSYKAQDKLKKKYDKEYHISYHELIQKLYDSKLKCYYCNIDLYLIYKNKNETTQWSLERFNNHLGHYPDNTCISCLKCNLQRRNENHEYFKFGKQLKIIKNT